MSDKVELVRQLNGALMNSMGKDFGIRADFVREIITALSERSEKRTTEDQREHCALKPNTNSANAGQMGTAQDKQVGDCASHPPSSATTTIPAEHSGATPRTDALVKKHGLYDDDDSVILARTLERDLAAKRLHLKAQAEICAEKDRELAAYSEALNHSRQECLSVAQELDETKRKLARANAGCASEMDAHLLTIADHKRDLAALTARLAKAETARDSFSSQLAGERAHGKEQERIVKEARAAVEVLTARLDAQVPEVDDKIVAWLEHHKAGDNLNWERVDHPYAKATGLVPADLARDLGRRLAEVQALYDAGCKQWNPVYKVVLERAEAAERQLAEAVASVDRYQVDIQKLETATERLIAEAVAGERAEWKSTMDTPEGSGARWIVGWHGQTMTPEFIWWTVEHSAFPANVTKWAEWKHPAAAAIRQQGGSMAEKERDLGRDLDALLVYLSFGVGAARGHKDTLVAAIARLAALQAERDAAVRERVSGYLTEQAAHVLNNAVSMKQFDIHEARCRELCASYLKELTMLPGIDDYLAAIDAALAERKGGEMSIKYVATFTLSAQVTEDSYRIFQHHLECTPATTLAEIFKWKEAFGKGATAISLNLETLEQLP